MANASKLMKIKKQRQIENLRKKKGLYVKESVEKIIEDVINVDSGTVTNIDVVDETIAIKKYTEEDLTNMKKTELQELCEELNLDKKGNKDDLIEKILNL